MSPQFTVNSARFWDNTSYVSKGYNEGLDYLIVSQAVSLIEFYLNPSLSLPNFVEFNMPDVR